jgi:DNA-binding MarR family transcriptional regulator
MSTAGDVVSKSTLTNNATRSGGRAARPRPKKATAERIPEVAPPRMVKGDRLSSLVGHRLRLAHLTAVSCFETAFEGQNLTPVQFAILESIAAHPMQAQNELAAAIRTAPSVLVGSIGKLEKDGLVGRVVDEDRRRFRLALTRSGQAKLQTGRERIAASERRLTQDLSAPEVATLLSLLGRVAGPA